MKITMPMATMIRNLLFNRLKISKLILLFGLLVPVIAFSQSDFESWNSITANFNVSKKTTFELANELRLDDNASGLKKYMVDLCADRKLNKYFDATLAYRYSRIDNLDAFVNEHMLYAKFAASYKLYRFEFSLQTRFQRANEVYGYSTLVKTTDTWRNKAGIEYNIYGLPLTPYINYELFTENADEGLENSKYRLMGGVKYKINKQNSLGMFYGIQQSLVKSDNSYIFGLKYNIDFDLRMSNND